MPASTQATTSTAGFGFSLNPKTTAAPTLGGFSLAAPAKTTAAGGFGFGGGKFHVFFMYL